MAIPCIIVCISCTVNIIVFFFFNCYWSAVSIKTCILDSRFCTESSLEPLLFIRISFLFSFLAFHLSAMFLVCRFFWPITETRGCFTAYQYSLCILCLSCSACRIPRTWCWQAHDEMPCTAGLWSRAFRFFSNANHPRVTWAAENCL